MGYTRDFCGAFKFSRTLTVAQRDYLNAFNHQRRMKRDPKIAETLPDPLRIAVGIQIGPDACFFTGGVGFCGQDDDKSVVNHNEPPQGQPGLWCKWKVDDTGDYLAWDGCEKFYDYVEWVKYLIKNFLNPWKIKLDGVIRYQGERRDDFGSIEIINSKVKEHEGVKLRPSHPKAMPRESTLHWGDKERGLLDSPAKLSFNYKKKK